LFFGALCAHHRNGLIDRFFSSIAFVGMSLPSFWVALLLLWAFAVCLRWFPAYGFSSPYDLILPALALSTTASGLLFRLVRSCILEAKGSAWMYTLKGKGLSEFAITTRHTLKNIAIPTLTQVVNSFILVLGDTIIVETIFGLPGIGFYLVHAVLVKDIPVVSGFVFALGLIVITVNLILELSYTILDPRTRTAGDA
jgi:peptide/nickel transport system permease protein